MGKRKRKEVSAVSQNKSAKDDESEIHLDPVVTSDEPVVKKTKWTNKQRVLIFSSRGISHRARHLMIDLRTMMPHSKSENKMDRKDKLFVINEVCEMKNCNKCIFFEAKKKMDLYMWVSNCPRGPSAKFLVENVHTMSELKMTGNCLKGSRPLLSFDKAFDEETHWSLLKELFIQIFGTPNQHPKSQPFFDHVFTFSISDNRIWFRNYQILEEDGSLAEIGPRFVLNPIRIFEGSFGGETLYLNPKYVSPNMHRRLLRRQVAKKYINRVQAKKSLEDRKPEFTYTSDITDDVFVTIQPEDAFDEETHWSLLKELFIQIFGTPNQHPKSQPFFDHVFTFSISDNRIWFRNYQILEEDGSLAEIGPRFVLNPIRIFEGSFGGETLYLNPKYVSPNMIFGTPNQHPKSQPFFDHVFTFSISDNRIWFRNYQILEEDGSLAEIGPRFVLNPIRIFEGSFGGETLYLNPKYVSPNMHRRLLRRQVAKKYINRVQAKKSLEDRKPEFTYTSDITDDVFVTIQPEDVKQNG